MKDKENRLSEQAMILDRLSQIGMISESEKSYAFEILQKKAEA